MEISLMLLRRRIDLSLIITAQRTEMPQILQDPPGSNARDEKKRKMVETKLDVPRNPILLDPLLLMPQLGYC